MTNSLLDLIVAGGWVMIPILMCSIIAVAIVAERLWTLRRHQVVPRHTIEDALYAVKHRRIKASFIKELATESMLGKVLACGLARFADGRQSMHDALEEAGRHAVHDLERYLNGLGTIAAIAPLLGLLGTVIGMIKVFSTITLQGVGNANALAGGISESLITTTFGLMVAIPALMAHRYLLRRIDGLSIDLEQAVSHFANQLDRVMGKNDEF